MVRKIFFMMGILSFSATANYQQEPATWTGLTAGKLLAISEQGDNGFQYSMLYIMGVADGIESQYVMNWQKACRSEQEMTNQEIASKVLTRMKTLNAPQQSAGKVAVNAYLNEYCVSEIIDADSIIYDSQLNVLHL
ncbi:hypothetical protein MD588_24960 [Photobacterium sp. SDRW27]|uniref:hypothetical protein n=1 Tax=Photobacterium obscurum TaxID=2829490 RepID=UPI0022446560|nr:hypothetical protein [Photobacterium obscurum]MCW8332047.1 hypothetical protein [Photobacterium obscurum]